MSAVLDFLDKPQERLHVYRLPTKLNNGFAFDRGNAISFLNVDFFDAPWDISRDDLVTFIKSKDYYNRHSRFLVLASSKFPTLCFTIEPESDPNAEPKPK